MHLLIRLAVLITLTFTAYSFFLGAPFRSMDDYFSIVRNPMVQDTSQWPQHFFKGYFNDQSYYRPLTTLSYALEHQFHGINALYYNLDNVYLHILNALLVWVLAAYLIGAECGFWVALLFAIHPIQWESVCNISGRAILLSTTFMLASFIAFIRNNRLGSLGAFVLGLLSKESAGVLPVILAAYTWFNRRKWLWMIVWGGVVGVYVVWRKMLGLTHLIPWNNPKEHALGFITFLRSVITDLRMFVLPYDLHFDRSQAVYKSFDAWPVILTIVFWVLAAGAWWFYRKKMMDIHWLCLIWFAVSLAPVSQIVTTIGVQPGRISSAEHFLYFACIPVFILGVLIVMRKKNTMIRMMSLIFIGYCFITTIEMNIYASNDHAMIRRSLQIQPENARLQSSIAMLYAVDEQYPRAEEHYRKAVYYDPLNTRYWLNLAKSICDQGRIEECLHIYQVIPHKTGYEQVIQERMQSVIKEHKQNP